MVTVQEAILLTELNNVTVRAGKGGLSQNSLGTRY